MPIAFVYRETLLGVATPIKVKVETDEESQHWY